MTVIESVSDQPETLGILQEEEIVDPLIQGIKDISLKIKKGPEVGKFNFIREIIKIKKSFSESSYEKLAILFKKIVNPKNIIDGHCSKCAFNTHMHLIGFDLQEAEDSHTDKFVKFSWWFHRNFNPEMVESAAQVEGSKSFEHTKTQVEKTIKKIAGPREAVLISINDGAHWFNAYNGVDKVWFIDSQGGKGFNLYSGDEDFSTTCIDIIRVKSKLVSEFLKDVV